MTPYTNTASSFIDAFSGKLVEPTEPVVFIYAVPFSVWTPGWRYIQLQQQRDNRPLPQLQQWEQWEV